MRPAAGLAFAVALLAGCSAVGPDYPGPPASTADASPAYPSALDGEDATAVLASEPPAAWWRQLGDPALDEIMMQALAANYDLGIAAANVEAARAVLAGVATRRLPAVDVGALVQERRDAAAARVTSDPHAALPTTSAATIGLDLSWEIDLFGRVRRSIEAAAAALGSLEALRNDVLTSVLAAVGRAYVDLRGAQARLEVAARNVAVQQQTLELVSVLNAEGAATELDVARARTQLLTSQATIPLLRAAAATALNRLTTLTAQPPGALGGRLAAPRPLPSLPEFVAVGAPADLLRRRPDIAVAERALAAATARIGVATAALFPTVTFGAGIGAAAAPISSLAAEGAPFFALGPALTWNVFDREAIYARIREADSAAAADLARYQGVVTTALEEVDSAISAYRNERARRVQLTAAVAASRDASRLARLRYREGVEDFLTVLDAERSLLQLEDQLALSDISLAQQLIDIHLALGGGWQAQAAPGVPSGTTRAAR